MSNLISYAQILKERNNFRNSGTRSGSEFNKFDVPGVKFFKLFFYFNNGNADGEISPTDSGGLLAPTWLINGVDESNMYLFNSAWSYLILNCEDERAEMLKKFINLLSNINSESPWYFSELSGLDAAMERKQTMEKDLKFEEARYKISIKCLPDSFDDRIATLLELYRSIVWSWIKKQEILPANLRKFDMGILIYETPNAPFHKYKEKTLIDIPLLGGDGMTYAQMGTDNIAWGDYKSSYKYIELHNCEFDYTSAKGNYGAINNAEGIQPEYTIDIHFDDCYETRYNEFMLQTLGDIINVDIDSSFTIYPVEAKNDDSSGSESMTANPSPRSIDLDSRISYYDNKGFLASAVDQLVGTGKNVVNGLVKKVALGNLHSFSLSRGVDQVKGLMSGDIWSAARDVAAYVNNAKLLNQDNSMEPGKTLFDKPKRIIPSVKRIGNMFEANTLVNNI